MRSYAAVILLAVLAACGESAAPAQPTDEQEQAVLVGRYLAASSTARDVTGGVDIQRGGLIFDSGVVAYTRVLAPRRASERIARDGDSYAAAALGPGDLVVELRRVTEQTVPRGRSGLCGREPPQYLALAYEPRAAGITLLVFTGDEPPAPHATQSRLCARFAYAAPDGARTRQGVVLR